MKQTLKILAGRMAAVALAAVLNALEKQGVPHDTKGTLAVAGIALGAVVAASPNLFAAAGILRPLSPSQASLYQKAVGGLAALIQTPAAKRRQKAQDDLQAFLDSPQTLETLRSRLLSREQLWQPGQPIPSGAATASVPPQRTAPETSPDPATVLTGGNQ